VQRCGCRRAEEPFRRSGPRGQIEVLAEADELEHPTDGASRLDDETHTPLPGGPASFEQDRDARRVEERHPGQVDRRRGGRRLDSTDQRSPELVRHAEVDLTDNRQLRSVHVISFELRLRPHAGTSREWAGRQGTPDRIPVRRPDGGGLSPRR